jgi:hypothetical protein
MLMTAKYEATLQGGQEVPAVPSPGSGYCRIQLVGSSVEVECSYDGLTGDAVMSHIHAAPQGSNGPVILALSVTGGTSGKITGSGMLPVADVLKLRAGETYINLHTTTFPPGELRGQILPAASVPVPASSTWSRLLGVMLLLIMGTASLRAMRE